MAAANGFPQPPRDPAEAKLLGRLRVISIAVILALIFLLVVADTLGRLLISPDFHVGDVIFATLMGALVTLLGIETIARKQSS